MPKLLDQYKLAGKKLGTRDPGDAAVEELARTIYQGPPERSAEAVAAALAEGISPEVVGEAISLASNLLVLRQGPDKWRTHGDSAGVHSSDATNAWRNMARIAQPLHAVSGLIVAAYHVAAHTPFNTRRLSDRRASRGDQGDRRRRPAGRSRRRRAAQRPGPRRRRDRPLRRAGSLRPRPCTSGCSSTRSAKTAGCTARSTSTPCRRSIARSRPAFRWRQLVGLARVTASAYGYDREDKHGRAPRATKTPAGC